MDNSFNPEGLFFRVTGKRTNISEIPWEKAETLVPSHECEIIKERVAKHGMKFFIRRKSNGINEFHTDDTGFSPFRKTIIEEPSEVVVESPSKKNKKNKKKTKKKKTS